MVCIGGIIMPTELTTYLIALIPTGTAILGLVAAAIKIIVNIRKITKRDSELATMNKELVKKIDEILADNVALRKENLILRRQNNKVMSKLTNVYIEDKGE